MPGAMGWAGVEGRAGVDGCGVVPADGIRSWPGATPCRSTCLAGSAGPRSPPGAGEAGGAADIGGAGGACCPGEAEGADGVCGAEPSVEGRSLFPPADLRTGRSTAGRRPSVVSRSSAGGVSGCLRGVNQPLPPLPPDVPLSADVVVGASMVCLASNIFRSFGALPHPEAACFPRGRLASPRSIKRLIQPYPTHIPTAYGQVRRECDIARSTLTRRPALDKNRSRPYRPALRRQVPPRSPANRRRGEPSIPSITGRRAPIRRHPTDPAPHRSGSRGLSDADPH